MPDGDSRQPTQALPRSRPPAAVVANGGVRSGANPLPTPPLTRDEFGHPVLRTTGIIADSQLLEDSDDSSGSDSSKGEHVLEDFRCFEEGGGEGGAEGPASRFPQQAQKPLETISEGEEGCCSSSLALSGVAGNFPSCLGTSDYSSSEDDEEEPTLKVSPGGTTSYRLNSYTASSSPSPSSTSDNSEDNEDAETREEEKAILFNASQNSSGVGGKPSKAGGAVRLPRLKSMVTNEDLTTTECEEDFQWVRGSSPSYKRTMGIEEEEPCVPPPNHPPPVLPLPPPLPAREKCNSGKEKRSPSSCKCSGSDDEAVGRRRLSRSSNTDSSSALQDSIGSQAENLDSSYRSLTPKSRREISPYGVVGGSLDRAKSRRPPPKLRPPLPPSHPPPPLRQRPPSAQSRKREDDRDSSCRCSPVSTNSFDGYRRLVDDMREDEDDEEEEDDEDEDGYNPYKRHPPHALDYDSPRSRLAQSPVNHCSCPRPRRNKNRGYQRNMSSPLQNQYANALVHRHPMCTSPCCHYGDQEHDDMQLSLPTPYDFYRWKLLLKGGGLVSEFEERVVRLESEKESLRLQVSVLTEQIEAQAEKICDLEKALVESRRRAAHTEELLQREMLTRSSLETQKLELLSAASDVRLHHATLERENLQLRERIAALTTGRQQLQRRADANTVIGFEDDNEGDDQGTTGRLGRQRNSREELSMVTSTPMAAPPIVENGIPGGMEAYGHGTHQGQFGGSPSPSPIASSISGGGSPRRPGYASNSMDDCQELRDPPPPAPRTPPASYRRKIDHNQIGGTLPRQNSASMGTSETSALAAGDLLRQTGPRKGVAFAETEKIIEDRPPNGYAAGEDNGDQGGVPNENGNDHSPHPSPSMQSGKPKGIKKIFGRLKRSGSGNLDDLPEGDFTRGGVRSTAGPRLGWTKDQLPDTNVESEAPFGSWDVDEVCAWLHNLGLGVHEAEAKKWGASGAKLLEAHPSDIEKELGVKNPLHRKKLQLAIIARKGPDSPGWDPGLGAADLAERGGGPSVSLGVAAPLGVGWVLRWLDDVGLPQHKEVFSASSVDARLLHRLTVEEATTLLHITSTLHLASLRRGIQVLRDFSFDPSCLIRRSVPADDVRGDGIEGEAQTTVPTINPSEVALWTNHRVMEWLRAVDLAEYAPNLRGSGVHGALMVYEPRFTADLLATLLSIPPAKTLLRRHLSTHFKDLVGRSVIGEKREAEASPGYVPLTATSKVKVAKKSQFTLKRKKSRTDFDFEDLVCPLVTGSRSSPDCKPSGDKAGNGDSVDLEAVQGVEGVFQENKKSAGLLCNDSSALLERTSNV